MNVKGLVILVFGIALGVISTIAGAHFFKSGFPTVESNTNHEESVRQATVTALIQKIAQLEVEEVIQGVIFKEDTPPIVALREQRSNLEERLAQLQPEGYQRLVVMATTGAIASKIADLEVQYAQTQTKFTEAAPELQVQKAQLEALRQRLITLQR